MRGARRVRPRVTRTLRRRVVTPPPAGAAARTTTRVRRGNRTSAAGIDADVDRAGAAEHGGPRGARVAPAGRDGADVAGRVARHAHVDRVALGQALRRGGRLDVRRHGQRRDPGGERGGGGADAPRPPRRLVTAEHPAAVVVGPRHARFTVRDVRHRGIGSAQVRAEADRGPGPARERAGGCARDGDVVAALAGAADAEPRDGERAARREGEPRRRGAVSRRASPPSRGSRPAIRGSRRSRPCSRSSSSRARGRAPSARRCGVPNPPGAAREAATTPASTPASSAERQATTAPPSGASAAAGAAASPSPTRAAGPNGSPARGALVQDEPAVAAVRERAPVRPASPPAPVARRCPRRS